MVKRQFAAFLLIAGGVLACVGLVLGLTPITQGGSNCGSAFKPSDDAAVNDLTSVMVGLGDPGTEDACSDATSSRKAVSLALLIPGGALVLAGGLVVVAELTSEPGASRAGQPARGSGDV